MSLAGKVAVVTASTRGIGLAIAKQLAARSAEVLVSSRKEENVKEAVDHLRSIGLANVHGIAAHVANRDDRKSLMVSV